MKTVTTYHVRLEDGRYYAGPFVYPAHDVMDAFIFSREGALKQADAFPGATAVRMTHGYANPATRRITVCHAPKGTK